MIMGRTDRRTDGKTDRRTDRVRRNMRPPPREEGRIISGIISCRPRPWQHIWFHEYLVPETVVVSRRRRQGLKPKPVAELTVPDR